MTNERSIEILDTMLKDGRYLETGSHISSEVLETFNKAKEALELQSSFINELKDLKEKTESYLETVNDELDWFGENKNE